MQFSVSLWLYGLFGFMSINGWKSPSTRGPSQDDSPRRRHDVEAHVFQRLLPLVDGPSCIRPSRINQSDESIDGSTGDARYVTKEHLPWFSNLSRPLVVPFVVVTPP